MSKVKQGIEIPWTSLSSEALEGLIEAFVLEEGTDYGHGEYPLAEKVARVRAQLASGQAFITFDSETETATIRARDA